VSTPTVLVVAQAQDGTADLVVDALLARGADVARIDTADFPGSLSLAATPDRIDSPGWLCARGRRIDAFAAEVGGMIVYKSLATGVVAEQDEVRIIYTSRLAAEDLDDRPSRCAATYSGVGAQGVRRSAHRRR